MEDGEGTFRIVIGVGVLFPDRLFPGYVVQAEAGERLATEVIGAAFIFTCKKSPLLLGDNNNGLVPMDYL